MSDDTAIFVGASDADQFLLLKYANRHGLITGATGTGKTVTLQTIAEGFRRIGVPVFMADVKGDLSGISQAGGDNPRAIERARQLKIEGYAGRGFPTIFWDLFGEQGPSGAHHGDARSGPLLLARLLKLNDTQEGVLNIVFKVADEQRPAAARLQGPAGHAAAWTAENAGSAHHRVRQRQHSSRSAPSSARLLTARAAGRRTLLRRAGARSRGHDRPRRRRAWASSTSSPPTS